MARVLEHKTEGVTLGVLDKDLRLEPDLQSVTYIDARDAVHTVFAHKNGPFRSVDDILAAQDDATLHTHETHQAAYDNAVLRGDAGTAARIKPLLDREQSQQQSQGGDD